MKKFLSCLLALLMTASLLAGCGQQKTDDYNGGDVTEPALADGVYTADFNTDSSMFHANETCDGKGVLTVKDGQMTIHVSLASTSVVNLFPGLKEDAQKDGAVLLQPTKDTVTYPDGLSEEVNGFDIPVPALDTEFDVALIGKKGVWYDHKVSVSNPVLKENDGDDAAAIALADGTYTIEVGFEGGSGKSHVLTPCTLKVENGAATATIVWSSEKYDYMLVDGQRYDVLTTEGGSTFAYPPASRRGSRKFRRGYSRWPPSRRDFHRLAAHPW